jgi:hypothetical protein
LKPCCPAARKSEEISGATREEIIGPISILIIKEREFFDEIKKSSKFNPEDSHDPEL